MNAIIIEDEFLAAIHAEAALEQIGIKVVGTAEDSAGALRLVDERPQLALVDLNLRDGFTGPRVAAYLASAGIGVVFVTANPGELEGLNPIGSPVLEKPVELPKLAEAIGTVTARRSA